MAYAPVRVRSMAGETGLGIAPVIIGAGIGLASKIFGGGPSAEQVPGGAEYEFRRATIQTADALARTGSRRDAWHLLGAIGRVQATPESLNIPELPVRGVKTKTGPASGTYAQVPAGYFSGEWGSSFQPLQQLAAQDYHAGKTIYATPVSSPVGAAVGASAPPMLQAMSSSPSGVSPTTLAMVAVGAVAVVTVLLRAGRR